MIWTLHERQLPRLLLTYTTTTQLSYLIFIMAFSSFRPMIRQAVISSSRPVAPLPIITPFLSRSFSRFPPAFAESEASSSSTTTQSPSSVKPPSLTDLGYGMSDLFLSEHTEPSSKQDNGLFSWSNSNRPTHFPAPGNQFKGRSIDCTTRNHLNNKEFSWGFRRLQGTLSRNRVKRELKLGEFYEKPSVRKRRLATERHRRRFQELVSSFGRKGFRQK